MMAIENWQKDYQVNIQIGAETNTNYSLAKQLALVGENKSVLEFGCATGYFSQMLSEKGCNVVGVEINANAAEKARKYCRKVIVADLDFTPLDELLLEQTFDVAIFGDVLEHLRDPWSILESVRSHLNPGGFIVASIPNIAHGAVRLSLLQGEFNYQQYGILDNTHIRFFTKSSINEMFEKTGYFLDVIDRTKVPILSGSDLLPRLNEIEVNSDILRQLELDEESETLQFVVRAYPESDKDRYIALANKCSELVKKIDELTMQNNKLSKSLSEVSNENSLIKRSKWWQIRKFFFLAK